MTEIHCKKTFLKIRPIINFLPNVFTLENVILGFLKKMKIYLAVFTLYNDDNHLNNIICTVLYVVKLYIWGLLLVHIYNFANLYTLPSLIGRDGLPFYDHLSPVFLNEVLNSEYVRNDI